MSRSSHTDDACRQELESLRARIRELERQGEEHERVREALRASENRYRTLLENAPLGIIAADAQGNITDVNRALLEILGSPSAQATRAINLLNFPLLIEAGVADDFRRCLETGRRVVSEHPYRSKWGKQTYLRYHLTPLKDENGRLVGVQGVVEDFSARKRAEDALKQAHATLSRTAEQLREANEELSQFATAVSHDIKAPLRAIRHYASVLAEDHADALPRDAQSCVERILTALDQADDLVNDLLELARIGRHTKLVPNVDLGRFFDDLVHSLDLPREAQFSFDGCDHILRSDPTLLRQVFQNLLLNAVKFNTSSLVKVDVSCQVEDNGTVEIRVSDNGIGINPKYHDRIFKVFERLHTRDEYEGTGIGLALVRKAVTRLGGSVHVESEEGNGAVFVVRLPGAIVRKDEENHRQAPQDS